ncbi:MAG TPA: acetyl-CoA carboxylase biotin carboxyl carrier protein [Acidobacteriota bacterium]|nr:acetyl-CoA carboxylase biotin carboxyl carrier protein [Acidobacteriota bacterium]
MNIKEIKELIELIQGSGIEEFEMERSGVRVRIKNSLGRSQTSVAPVEPLSRVTHEPSPEAAQEIQPPEEPEEEFHIFTAPIVGTFYLTPKPDAEPFVRPGDFISKGSVLCIIEAMKIFNQIESDVSGEIVQILADNGQPVEYGQPLFKIRLVS